MINYNNWRDLQISNINKNGILVQEQNMLSFVSSIPNVVWNWYGDNTKFKNLCQQFISLSNVKYNGAIIFGEILTNVTSKSLSRIVTDLIKDVNFAYVGINRYEIIKHDLPFDLPDDLGDSIDKIMNHIHPKFERLHKFDEVTGRKMVYVHPMDCYKLCK